MTDYWFHLSAACIGLCIRLSMVTCYPDGNMLPESICVDMKPRSAVGVGGMEGHLLPPQNIMPGHRPTLPYYIYIHQEEKDYKTGSDIQVSVIANQTRGIMYYTGLLLQARKVICASNNTVMVEERALGSFTVPPNPRDSQLATMDCSGENSRSAVRHRSNSWKVNETFTWRSPNTNEGNVVFRAVIIHHGDHYWSDVNSPVLREPGHADVVPPSCGAQDIKANILSLFIAVFSYSMLKQDL